MPVSFIISKNIEHSLEKTPRELMERFTNLTHLLLLVMSLTKFMYFSFLHTELFLRLDMKTTVSSRVYTLGTGTVKGKEDLDDCLQLKLKDSENH